MKCSAQNVEALSEADYRIAIIRFFWWSQDRSLKTSIIFFILITWEHGNVPIQLSCKISSWLLLKIYSKRLLNFNTDCYLFTVCLLKTRFHRAICNHQINQIKCVYLFLLSLEFIPTGISFYLVYTDLYTLYFSSCLFFTKINFYHATLLLFTYITFL